MVLSSKSYKPEVSISKGDTPKESLINGIKTLGGISRFIDEGDQIFIKFNLTLPGGFPTNTNLDVLDTLIDYCKEAGAKKIYLGSFPSQRIPIKVISNMLNLQKHFSTLGADLVFLDNSNDYENEHNNHEQLKKMKLDSHTTISVNEKEFLVPNICLNSNKFISINQINVNPLFKFNSSILNSYSIISPKDQEIGEIESQRMEYVTQDQYKSELISKILDVFTIKEPNLVINDLFFILEGAGPQIYKDSQLKKTNLMILGDDSFAVDIITMKVLNLDASGSELITHARKRDFRIPDDSNIRILGEKLENIKINVALCISDLKDIKVRNFSLKSGQHCSGCFVQAYHLLNIMKTYMGKDLKYNVNNSFLIGDSPDEPTNIGNIILFGDCAINSTKNYNFRNIIIKSEKHTLPGVKDKLLRKNKSKKETKTKTKTNKNILELSGCPPDTFKNLEAILNYYGKKNVPNLNLLRQISNLWNKGKLNDKLNIWEAL
jgi:uncharacterized protein (DUF362 family)